MIAFKMFTRPSRPIQTEGPRPAEVNVVDAANDWISMENINVLNVETLWSNNEGYPRDYGIRVWYKL